MLGFNGHESNAGLGHWDQILPVQTAALDCADDQTLASRAQQMRREGSTSVRWEPLGRASALGHSAACAEPCQLTRKGA